MSKPAVDDPQLGGILEKLGTSLLAGMYDEKARRAGKRFSSITRVPGVVMLAELDPIAALSTLARDSSVNERVPGKCSRCEVEMEVPRLSQYACACDACREAAVAEDRKDRCDKRWGQVCSPSSIFRKTDPTHPSFPTAQFEATKGWFGEESLIFLGPSGKGKSRLAMHLLKRCLYLRGKSIVVLWPEKLAHYARNQYERSAGLDEYAGHDVLLLDDPLLGSAIDDRISSFLRELLDMRARDGKIHLMTSQFGGTEYRAAFDGYMERTGQKASAQDWARFDALFRRCAEGARVVSFGEPEARKADGGLDF
jgi:hypothetical protein